MYHNQILKSLIYNPLYPQDYSTFILYWGLPYTFKLAAHICLNMGRISSYCWRHSSHWLKSWNLKHRSSLLDWFPELHPRWKTALIVSFSSSFDGDVPLTERMLLSVVRFQLRALLNRSSPSMTPLYREKKDGGPFFIRIWRRIASTWFVSLLNCSRFSFPEQRTASDVPTYFIIHLVSWALLILPSVSCIVVHHSSQLQFHPDSRLPDGSACWAPKLYTVHTFLFKD